MKIAKVLGLCAVLAGAATAHSAVEAGIQQQGGQFSAHQAARRLAGGNAGCGAPRVRRPWRNMAKDEQDLYIEALSVALKSGAVRDFAAIHIEDLGEAQAHHSCGFFTWHRRMLLAFESYLRDLDDKFACVTIPFYDVQSAYIDQTNGGCSNMFECSDLLQAIGGAPSGSQGQLQVNGVSASGIQHRGRPFTDACDDGDTCGYIVRDDTTTKPVPSGAGFGAFQNLVAQSTDFATFLEGIQFGLHNDVHNAVGGCMSTFASPRDVFFYSWHSAIDMYLYIYHLCNFGNPVTESDMETSLRAFTEATQSCGGITGVDAQSEIIMNIRVNGQLMRAEDHPTLGRYFAHVGDRMWNYGDIRRLDDYSYSYDLPPIFETQLLSNPNICPGYARTQPKPTPGPKPTKKPKPSNTPKPAQSETSKPTLQPDDGASNGKGNSTTDKSTTKPTKKPTGKPSVKPSKKPSNRPNPAKQSDVNGSDQWAGDASGAGHFSNNTSGSDYDDDDDVGLGHTYVISNSTASSNSYEKIATSGEYWMWAKKTYDGLNKRFKGNYKLVAQQMHIAECLAFDNVYGIRDYSDEFATNFHLASKRPVCGKRVDQVKAGEVTCAIETTEFEAEKVEFKSEEVIRVVEDTYRPLVASQAPLIESHYVQKAEKMIITYSASPVTRRPAYSPVPVSSEPAYVPDINRPAYTPAPADSHPAYDSDMNRPVYTPAPTTPYPAEVTEGKHHKHEHRREVCH